MVKSILHQAETRGIESYGWLESYHTFSFGNYYNPDRMHFGVLRVLNDDTVEPGMGFDTHYHENMEIITIPLEGELEHEDNKGNRAVIKKGDVQVMSAGTGIFHSEYNKNKERKAKFLQIWLTPDKENVVPRYDQFSGKSRNSSRGLQQIVSPEPESQGVWIHQNAWFQLGKIGKGVNLEFKIKAKGNGIYAFVINGNVIIDDQKLMTRDGLGIWDTDKIYITTITDAELLLMDIPMSLK